ncbi:hypothetical protein CC2G_007613 [Coprinopsis cinerea AmutBmut pab1-1]|nr:hypothetical protein CC2G_007613 [Coprinopsis cinerea AmutBmut pab1-1]
MLFFGTLVKLFFVKRKWTNQSRLNPNWPSYLHNKCNNPLCRFANPPQAAKGKYVCCGLFRGRPCEGTYYVSDDAVALVMKQHKTALRKEEKARQRAAERPRNFKALDDPPAPPPPPRPSPASSPSPSISGKNKPLPSHPKPRVNAREKRTGDPASKPHRCYEIQPRPIYIHPKQPRTLDPAIGRRPERKERERAHCAARSHCSPRLSPPDDANWSRAPTPIPPLSRPSSRTTRRQREPVGHIQDPYLVSVREKLYYQSRPPIE